MTADPDPFAGPVTVSERPPRKLTLLSERSGAEVASRSATAEQATRSRSIL